MAWYEEFYARVDAMDVDGVLEQCTPDTTIRFANQPVSEGAEAVQAALRHVWSTIAGLEHSITRVIESGDEAVLEAIVTYTLPDGRTVPLPTATVIERRGGRIAAQRIYADIAPLGVSGGERISAVGMSA
jgi:ketosteroid isomerase-like protein